MSEPIRVAVTGAAGQIGYALLFRIASGQLLGSDCLIQLQLLEIPPAMDALKGVVMELEDCASPLVRGIVQTDRPEIAFEGADVALLVGSRPRSPGMERNDLLEANGAIFSEQGRVLNDRAAKHVKVLVVGNPANTNCLIALHNAPDLDPSQFAAMTRLDHNRAKAQLAQKVGRGVESISGLAIWGNHSATMFPELGSAMIDDVPALECVDMEWYESSFIPVIQQRGAAILQARGLSSAASAANAAVEQTRDWFLGTDEVTSMAIYSTGMYDIAQDVVFSYPVICNDGEVSVDQSRELDDFSREKIAVTEKELLEEREAVLDLL